MTVELSVSVYPPDVAFFDSTYRHVVGQLRTTSITHRRVVVDASAPTGRYVAEGTMEALDETLAELVREGLVDSVDRVDWSAEAVGHVRAKYFRDDLAPTKAEAGSPIHGYLWALDTASTRYVLHLDCDMLLHHPDGGTWVDEGLAVLGSNPEVAVITPEGGPPQATGAPDWILGHRAEERPPWHVSDGTSTRIFLIDRERLAAALPLLPEQSGENLERTLTVSLARNGLVRWSRNDDHSWAIHPRRHNDHHLRNLDALIGIVEAGTYPYRRSGYRWDLRTEGRHFLPWWLAIQRHRLLRHGRRTT